MHCDLGHSAFSLFLGLHYDRIYRLKNFQGGVIVVDWKQIPKIDAHIHLLPDDVIHANAGCDNPFVDNGGVGDYLKIMETYNIESAFMMPFNDVYMLSMDFTVETVHHNLRSMTLADPGKLKCFADVDIRKDIHQTLEELDRVLAQEGFIGIKLHPSNTGYPIDGQYYDEILRYARDRNILVEIHSYPRENLPDDVCAPCRIKNILNKYPGLRLSIAHLGGFQYEDFYGVNAYFNLSASLPDIVNRFGIEHANQILRSIGVEKLVFATDYPDSRCLNANEIYDKYFEILGQMDFTEKEARQICKDNALKMINA